MKTAATIFAVLLGITLAVFLIWGTMTAVRNISVVMLEGVVNLTDPRNQE